MILTPRGSQNLTDAKSELIRGSTCIQLGILLYAVSADENKFFVALNYIYVLKNKTWLGLSNNQVDESTYLGG